MARSLPLYLNNSAISLTASDSAPVSTSLLSYGQAGVLVIGAWATLGSTGGKVTVTIRDGSTLATSPVIYEVEFDFTSVTSTADFQSVPIPCMNAPSYTTQADATADGKTFTFSVALQKISVEG
jgi:hypothetical protein